MSLFFDTGFQVREIPNLRDNVSAQVSQESDSEENVSVVLDSDADVVDEERDNEQTDETDAWNSDTASINDFLFDHTQIGVKLYGDLNSSPYEIFNQLWNNDIMELLVNSTNNYGKSLTSQARPKTRNSRSSSFKETTRDEMQKFIGLCLLQGQIKVQNIRKLFSLDPLNYHPIFSSMMTGRRFEQLLRCFSVHGGAENPDANDRLQKIRSLLNICLRNFQDAYTPAKELSLDESLLLFRGRLSFRTYMKNKKTKYGIKFYELCSYDGYVLNLDIYKGQGENGPDNNMTILERVVMKLMQPYVNKGYHLFMDNYYNSITLANRLLQNQTHVTGTLRSNRRGNPKVVVNKRLRKGDHIWKRQGKIYVSKWKDKRDVLCLTTAHHPTLAEARNRYNQIRRKPVEIIEYNKFMSGIDRSDQMISYYSCPRKTIYWYKKVIFHLLDITVWNSYFLYRKVTQNTKIKRYIQYREALIRSLLGIDNNLKDGRFLVKLNPIHQPTGPRPQSATRAPSQHFQELIPRPDNYSRKFYYLRCKQCSKEKKRTETHWRCKTCQDTPPLCAGPCFERWHKENN